MCSNPLCQVVESNYTPNEAQLELPLEYATSRPKLSLVSKTGRVQTKENNLREPLDPKEANIRAERDLTAQLKKIMEMPGCTLDVIMLIYNGESDTPLGIISNINGGTDALVHTMGMLATAQHMTMSKKL